MNRTFARNFIRQRRTFCLSCSLNKELLPTSINFASPVSKKNRQPYQVRNRDQSKLAIRFFSNKIRQSCHVNDYNQSKIAIRFFSTTDSTFTMEYEISCSELHEDILNNKNVYVIDVREPSEIDVQGKIPGSILIPCKFEIF